jgi:hypothetical protein
MDFSRINSIRLSFSTVCVYFVFLFCCIMFSFSFPAGGGSAPACPQQREQKSPVSCKPDTV